MTLLSESLDSDTIDVHDLEIAFTITPDFITLLILIFSTEYNLTALGRERNRRFSIFINQ